MRPALLPLVLMAFVACNGAAQETVPPEATTPTPEPRATCTNSQDGYTLAYPEDWHTNAGDIMPECSVFDPQPFDLEPATEIPSALAVRIVVDPIEFERVAEPTPEFERELDREELQIEGRQALRSEVEMTRATLLPEGTRVYRYAIDLNGRTMIASTSDVGDADYEEKKEVLDRMMENLELP